MRHQTRFATSLALRLAALALLMAGCSVSLGEAGGPDAGGSLKPGNHDAEPGVELCNGIDDDGDMLVDEGCTCTAGATQSCWAGVPEQQNTGVCAAGLQTCTGTDEFSSWGDCVGAVLPGDEICANGTDDDCDSLVDCSDPDCSDEPACACNSSEEICNDGLDNDCDGLVDCDDLDDCIDDIEMCTCVKQCPPGSTRWCDEPVYCAWGRQDCNPDGTWGACVETAQRPPGCDGQNYNLFCCLLAGECCQALPLEESLGECPPMEIVCDPA